MQNLQPMDDSESTPLAATSSPTKPKTLPLEQLQKLRKWLSNNRTQLPALAMAFVCSATTTFAGIAHELISGECMLRGLVHAGIVLLFCAMHASRSHPVGQAFVASACAMLAVTFWSVGGVSDAALVAAALSLSTCEVVRPGVLCCFGAAALTLPRFALERLAGPSQLPLALLELIAASFHRSFIVCLGWPRLSDDGLAPAAVYANALLAGCWWAAGGERAAVLAVAGVALEAPRLASLSYPQRHGARGRLMPPPPLFAMRGGGLVALANAGYTAALLADVVAARARTPPPQLLLATLTRCVHVGAWLAFVVAIAPRVRNVRHVRSLLLLLTLLEGALCYSKLPLLFGFAGPAARKLFRGAAVSPKISFARAAFACATCASFFRVRPRDEAEEKEAEDDDDGRTLRHGAIRRCVIWVCIAQYAVLHVAFSLAQRTLEDRVSCTFHFSFITVVFAGWAVAYGDAMPHAMTLIFTALEALGCAVHVALPAAGQEADGRAVGLAASSAALLVGVATCVPVRPRPARETFLAMEGS